MQKEIEIKVRLNNVAKVRDYLEKEANPLGEKEQIDTYFVMPEIDFFEEKPVHRYLRVRQHLQASGSIDLHVCNLDGNNKLLWTDEYECKLENPEVMLTIFDKIGLIRRVTVKKQRQKFKYQDFVITIDEIDSLGTFIEIEITTEEELDEDKAKFIKNRCFECLEQIQAEWEKVPDLGYPELILKKERLTKDPLSA